MQTSFDRFASLVRQFIYALIGLCSYFVMQPAFAADSNTDLKILSLNFNSEVMSDDGDYRIRERRFSAMVSYINDTQPDALLVQNGWSYKKFKSVATPLASATGYDSIYQVVSGGPIKGYVSNFILAKKKFSIDQQKNLKNFALGSRIHLDNGSTAYLYSAYLTGKTDADRMDQLATIDKAVQDHAIANYEYPSEAKIIVAGDFGSDPGSLSIYEISRRGYYDSFKTAHPNREELKACSLCSDPLTLEFNPMTGANEKNRRTDYIFSRGTTLQTRASTLVFSKPVSGMWMSSHNGVLTTFATNHPPGNIIGSVPNPVYDRATPQTFTKIIHLNDQNLNCTSIGRCTHALSDSDVSTERGITFMNDTKNEVHIQFDGSGEAFSKNSKNLAKGKSASFFFEPSQKYNFTAKKVGTLKKLVGTVFSNLE